MHKSDTISSCIVRLQSNIGYNTQPITSYTVPPAEDIFESQLVLGRGAQALVRTAEVTVQLYTVLQKSKPLDVR